MSSLDGLPDDASGLRDAVLAMRAELVAERALRRGPDDQNERLRHFIRQLQRMQFGRRAETLAPDQLNLALEDLEQAVAEADAEAEKADAMLRRARGRERRQSRGALPEHLPRVVIEPTTTVCPILMFFLSFTMYIDRHIFNFPASSGVGKKYHILSEVREYSSKISMMPDTFLPLVVATFKMSSIAILTAL